MLTTTTTRVRKSKRAVALGLFACAVVTALVAGPALSAAAADGSTIVGTETDAKGRNVILRQGTYNGSTGFGWTKIQLRHGIMSKNSIGFVLKAPNGGIAQGEDRLYVAYANQIVCTSRCEVQDSREVRVINKTAGYADYYGVHLGGKVVGITTAYCINPGGALRCPAWVDLAIGVNKPKSATRVESGETTSTTWSYEPMDIGEVVP